MPEPFAQPNDWRKWQDFEELEVEWVPEPECGAWQAVFWITTGALVGFVVGLIAWSIWGAP